MAARLIGGLTLYANGWNGTLSNNMTVQTGTFAGMVLNEDVLGWAAWNPYCAWPVVESSNA